MPPHWERFWWPIGQPRTEQQATNPARSIANQNSNTIYPSAEQCPRAIMSGDGRDWWRWCINPNRSAIPGRGCRRGKNTEEDGFLCVCRALTSVWGGKNSHKKVPPPPPLPRCNQTAQVQGGSGIIFFSFFLGGGLLDDCKKGVFFCAPASAVFCGG